MTSHTAVSSRPRIGLTLDAEPPGGYSGLPWYALRQNYFAAVVEAGGLPVALPHEPELAITRAALARDMPVLGICGGQQLLNVALGGTLIQHIPDAIPGCLAHEQPNPRTEPGHTVAVLPGSLLHRLIGGRAELPVNSAHHQAALDVGAGVVVSARAPDGVIEAIEDPGRRFCLGVQWHPEYGISAGDPALFRALVEACRG